MTINTTRWSPDTCACVIEYTWDDSVPDSSRVHTLGNIINKCSDHSSLSNANVYTALTEENPRKNITKQHILDNSPTTALYDIVNGNRQLKPNIFFNYSFSGTAPNRVLTISFTGITLTTNQKNTIQSALNTRFGSGKVLIV